MYATSMKQNPLRIENIHHVEFCVGNAKHASYFCRQAFGFSQLAYCGLETGNPQYASYVLGQGAIRFVITTPLCPDNGMSDHIKRHGDGVRDISFQVESSEHAFEQAVRRGAKPLEEPHSVDDRNGSICRSAIHAYGETIHSFISNGNYSGPFMPGFEPLEILVSSAGIQEIDHIAANVEFGELDHWAQWYAEVFGFVRLTSFEEKDIATEDSGLVSVVMSSESLLTKFAINEPSNGQKKSQIQEYIDWYKGAGVQHIALRCSDARKTVRILRAKGVDFLDVVQCNAASDSLSESETVEQLNSMGLLIDYDDDGYIIQSFTKPLGDRPTLFFEIIQREGCQSFGRKNFRSLFRAIEKEQAKRGNF